MYGSPILPVFIPSMRKSLLLTMFLIAGLLYAQDSLHVSPCGQKLKSFYLNMDVLHKWLSGQHIDWQTGVPDDPDAVSGIRTHCSAFVAAACERLGIYILRPPEHRQELLANAQYSWLNSKDAGSAGWHLIEHNVLYEAQKMADQGYIVVACAQNPDRHKPGILHWSCLPTGPPKPCRKMVRSLSRLPLTIQLINPFVTVSGIIFQTGTHLRIRSGSSTMKKSPIVSETLKFVI